MIRYDCAAGRTKEVASSQGRRTDLAKHPQLPPTTRFRLAKDIGGTSAWALHRMGASNAWSTCCGANDGRHMIPRRVQGDDGSTQPMAHPRVWRTAVRAKNAKLAPAPDGPARVISNLIR